MIDNNILRYLYIVLGSISLGLGLVGIVTPGLPTTPFLLLTAYLYARSSPSLHQRLTNHKVTGYYLNKMKGGLSLKARLIPIGIMWIMVCVSAFIIFDGTMRYVMLGLGVVGTIAQLIVLGKDRRKIEKNIDTDLEEISGTAKEDNVD